MIIKNIYRLVKVICLLIVCWLPWEAVAEDGGFSIVSSITRLQVREAIDESHISSYTFSSYLRAENKTYLLGIVDYQIDKDRDKKNGQVEVDIGGPLVDSPLGWAARGRLYYQQNSAAAVGLQLNFNDLPGLGTLLKKGRTTTFLQVFRNTNDPYFGDFEVLHYYNVDFIPKRLSLRGYNVFNNGKDAGAIKNLWADLIYSMGARFDVYYRINHVNKDNEYLGERGTAHYIGMRINWY